MKLEGKILNEAIQLKKFLGEGATGEVYSGAILETLAGLQPDDRIAVKIYKPQTLEYPNQYQRIEREFRVGATLSHQNLVKIYHMGLSHINDVLRPYLLMELLEGVTLRDYVEVHYPLAEATIITLLQQLCDAIHCLHSLGIIHRDIKPENVMILENSKLKLMDFGVLKDPKSTPLTDSDNFLGTIRYASPEYLFELSATEKSDAYSVGAVLYFMIYGHDIFHHEKLFSKLIRLIDSADISIYVPNRQGSKKLCLLLEIARRLLLKDAKKRLSLSSAVSEIGSSFNGNLWKAYIIPLIHYRAASIWQWERKSFPDNPELCIFTALQFLPMEFYSTVASDLPDEEYTKVYVGENVDETITKLENLKRIVNIEAVGSGLEKWKQCFLVADTTEQKIALLRSILCKAISIEYENYDELYDVTRWAKTQTNNHEITKFCEECIGWLNSIYDLLHT